MDWFSQDVSAISHLNYLTHKNCAFRSAERKSVPKRKLAWLICAVLRKKSDALKRQVTSAMSAFILQLPYNYPGSKVIISSTV